jgi:GT2 family glycosyltransferase
VRSTTAQWTAFVDDDCFLEPDWIANAIAFSKSHPTAGAFGGRVVLDWEAEPPAYLRAYGYSFAEQNHGDSERAVAFLAGAGLVVNRDALTKCEWINGPLIADRVGESLVSGGDVEIVLRISAAGYALWYVPECKIHHRIPLRRTHPAYLRDINRNLGVSQTLADALVYTGSDLRWILGSFSKGADQIPGLLRLARQAARRSRSMTDISIQASFTLGRLLGIWRIFRMSPSRRHALVGRARQRGAIG